MMRLLIQKKNLEKKFDFNFTINKKEEMFLGYGIGNQVIKMQDLLFLEEIDYYLVVMMSLGDHLN